MTLAEALARLAAVPPKLFTRERRSLVEAMRAAGDSKTARVVQARRAPTIPVWVANRLAREHAKSLDDLIAAANHLKAASSGDTKGLATSRRSWPLIALRSIASWITAGPSSMRQASRTSRRSSRGWSVR